jgi:hypothetical protein
MGGEGKTVSGLRERQGRQVQGERFKGKKTVYGFRFTVYGKGGGVGACYHSGVLRAGCLREFCRGSLR